MLHNRVNFVATRLHFVCRHYLIMFSVILARREQDKYFLHSSCGSQADSSSQLVFCGVQLLNNKHIGSLFHKTVAVWLQGRLTTWRRGKTQLSNSLLMLTIQTVTRLK